MAYLNCTVLHTNTHLGYDWTRNGTYAPHTLCVFLGAGTHSLRMHAEHQVSPRQERKKETSNLTRCRLDQQQAAFLPGIKSRMYGTYNSSRKLSPNWRLSVRPLQLSEMATNCVNCIFSAFLIPNWFKIGGSFERKKTPWLRCIWFLIYSY